jgi:predicted porin
MKKHLIAVAVAAAVTAPVMAQNVTIYGVLDVGLVNTDTANTTGIATNVSTQNGSGQLATSILGLKGSEDLGGGLKAAFDLQGELNSQSGSGSGVSSGSGFAFNRQSWVSIGSSSMGTLKVGRTGTYADQNYGGAAHGWVFFLPSASARSESGKVAGITEYVSPEVVKGLKVTLQNRNAQVDASQNVNASGNSWGLNYANGPWAAAYGISTSNDANSNDAETSVASVSYDFGMAKLTVVRLVNEIQSTTATNADTNSTSVGVAVPLSGGMTVVANYENFSDKQSATTDYKRMGVGIKKDLSKRTSVFAAYRSQDTASTGADIDTSVVGIQHSF